MKSMLVLALASALAFQAQAQTPAAETTTADAETPAVVLVDPPETLLAVRGKAEVHVADVDAFMSHVPERDRPAVVASEERVSNLLQGILLNRQLSFEAEAAGLDKDPKVQLEIRLAREQVLARHALKHHISLQPKADLEQLAKESYMAEKEKFRTPETRVVQHILIANKTRSDDEAKALVAKVEAEARAPGADFDALVEKYSDDGGKVQNRGFYPINPSTEPKMDPSFVAGAKQLQEVGEISSAVPGMYGYHILKLSNLTPSRTLSFEETRAQIIDALRTSADKRIEDEHVATLRSQNPEIVTEVAQRLKTRYTQTPLAPAAATPETQQ